MKRLTPADSARMYQGLESENDIETLFTVAVDQELPRDIRRKAGERLNDLRLADVVDLIPSLPIALLAKIAHTGMVDQRLAATAKGAYKSRVNGNSGASNGHFDRLIGLLEEQNRLLRQARWAGVRL